jgi:hypothetical protein
MSQQAQPQTQPQAQPQPLPNPCLTQRRITARPAKFILATSNPILAMRDTGSTKDGA